MVLALGGFLGALVAILYCRSYSSLLPLACLGWFSFFFGCSLWVLYELVDFLEEVLV